MRYLESSQPRPAKKHLAVIIVASVSLFFLIPTPTSGQRLRYNRYLAVEAKEKAKLVDRLVQRDYNKGYWTVVQSKYRIYCSISAEYTLRTAVLMDDFYAKFSKLFKGSFRIHTQPTVYVFADATGFRSFLKTKGIEPGFAAGLYIFPLRMLVAHRGFGDATLKQLLFHEGTHQLLHAYMGEKRLPIWINEGLATNFETWDLERNFSENAKLSIVFSEWRRIVAKAYAAKKVYTLERLISFTDKSWLQSSSPDLNYSMAWSFTNSLLSTPKGRKKLSVILTGMLDRSYLERILSPRAQKRLQADWHEDVKMRIVPYDRFIVPALLLSQQKRYQQSLALFETGLDDFPKLIDGRFYRGYILSQAGRYDAALSDLRAVERTDPDFPGLYRLLGRIYLTTKNLSKARIYLLKAAKQDAEEL